MAKRELQHIKKEKEESSNLDEQILELYRQRKRIQELVKRVNQQIDLYNKVRRMKIKEKHQRHRIKKLEEELKKKYPEIKVDKSLLKLVGTMPYNPPLKDKKAIHNAVSELYGK